jgi:hypothetical protein
MRKVTTVLVTMGLVAYGTVARSQTLDVQEQCASQARKAFQDLENENRAEYRQSTLIQKGVSDYQSHYQVLSRKWLEFGVTRSPRT